jgi:hypothetical protein
MKNLNAKFVRSYRAKGKGTVTFVYAVSGSEDNLKEYERIQGDFLRKDDKGVNLWFTTRFVGNSAKLIITEKDSIVPDMSAFDQAASLATQYGGNLGQELARTAAAQLLNGGGSPANQSVSSPVVDETASTDGIGKI